MKDYRQSHTEERIAKQYEEVVYKAGSYDDMLWQWEKNMLLKELAELQKEMSRVAYLDFGCGTGRILVYLEDKVGRAVGVDPAKAMIQIARERARHSELVVADITKNDVLSGQAFDLITAFRIFLNSQPELREDMFRVLAPKLRGADARFIFNIHGNLWSYRLFSKAWYWLRGRRLNTMTARQARSLAVRHGLEVERWYGFGVKPKFLYRLFGPRFMFAVDSALSKIPGLKYISYDLVFVCRQARNTH